jgi:hypothetical protein
MAKLAIKAGGKADGAMSADESISGYFRKIFLENPKLLKQRSNDELLRLWLADHPGHTDVPQKIKNNLANIKSVMRKKLRKRGGRPPKAEQPVGFAGEVARTKVSPRGLEALEEQIDECLDAAKRLDREGLQEVIGLLRRARNSVVWLGGQ